MNVLVLIHAFPVGVRMWDGISVPEGWRVVVPRLPGFDGAPLPPAGSTSIDDYARAVLDRLDAQGVTSFVAGGVSLGGYVTFGLWRLAASRISGLVLADTRAGADAEAAKAGRQKMLDLVRRDGPGAVAGEMLPKLLGETTRRERPEVGEHVRRMIEAQTTEGIAAAIVRLRDRPDSTPLLSRIRVPTLVVVGEEDELTPPAESEAMRAALPDASLVRIPAAGHLSNIEQPAAFNAALASFLTARC